MGDKLGPGEGDDELRHQILINVRGHFAGLLYVILPLTDGWTLWQRTMVLVPIMVAAMAWRLIPAVQRLFRNFLNPPVRGAKAG